MPRYIIVLLDRPSARPGGSGVANREESQFPNLGDALHRAREMYRSHEESAIGFQIRDAAGVLIHEWRS